MKDLIMIAALAADFFLLKLFVDWCDRQLKKR